MSLLDRIRSKAARTIYGPLENVFRSVERGQMSRGAVLEHIPSPHLRGGGLGTTTYGEWCYIIGIFQSLIFQNLPADRPVKMLDVGCGVGRLYLAAKSYLIDQDSYLGIDVGKSFIDICRQQYREPNVHFLHTVANNAYYAKDAVGTQRWPIEDSAHNLITALSVWTHLREEHWRFYLNEVGRVLSPSGRAIISFFIRDEFYRPEVKGPNTSRFYPQPENKWIFDKAAYDSKEWTYPSWANVPEVAIAAPMSALEEAAATAGLKIAKYYPGQWKEQPGFFFQDVVVFERS